MNFLEAWDIGIRDGLEPLHRPWLTHLMRFLSALGTNEVLAVVALLSMVFFIFIGRWRTGLCLVAAGLLGYGIEHAVKPWVNRPRPDVKWVEPQDKKTTPSFPSGHALLTMAVYGTLALSLAAAMENRKAKALDRRRRAVPAPGNRFLADVSRRSLLERRSRRLLRRPGMRLVIPLDRLEVERGLSTAVRGDYHDAGAYVAAPILTSTEGARTDSALQRRADSTLNSARRRIHRGAKAVPRFARVRPPPHLARTT